MDGQHFHADEGPVPAWVVKHFADLKRRSEEIRREIDVKSAELRAGHAANVERSKRLNAKYAAGGVEAVPDIVAPPRLVTIEEIGLVEVGGSRADVIRRLGAPASAITIPGDEGTVETLSYRTAPDRAAKINLRDGRVVEVFLP